MNKYIDSYLCRNVYIKMTATLSARDKQLSGIPMTMKQSPQGHCLPLSRHCSSHFLTELGQGNQQCLGKLWRESPPPSPELVGCCYYNHYHSRMVLN